MNIEKKDNYTLVTPTETSLELFLEALSIADFEKENLILNFINTFDINTSQVDSFSEISQHKKENGTSFIIIVSNIDIDDLEDECMSVVPTLGEAEDTLEMDAIERDLGF
tara:strand:- start:68133 stop:68462 length:330 start_codon:yes stop_codon:yes gene_type:complete